LRADKARQLLALSHAHHTFEVCVSTGAFLREPISATTSPAPSTSNATEARMGKVARRERNAQLAVAR
jgi:hypothetical protein